MYRIAFFITDSGPSLLRQTRLSRQYLCIATFDSALQALRFYLALASLDLSRE
jgi:hypothetical protein